METHPTTILLIEDDEDDYILLKKLLNRVHDTIYNVIRASSYQAGLTQLLEAHHDLCLLDYRLGPQTGISLIQESRRQGYQKPIILLTGVDGESQIDIQAIQAGADDYIAKGDLQEALLHRMIRYAIERKKAEHERERLLSEQIQTQELDKRRNQFISMVVHELKTPLTSLKGFEQLLSRKLKAGTIEQVDHMVDRMDAQISKLTTLIDDLRDATKIEGGYFQCQENMFAFDQLVNGIIEESQLLGEVPSIQIEGKTHKMVWGDQERIGQVITNFLTNAIKYADHTKTIVVRTSTDNQAVTLYVQDSGPGIPKEKQAHIFDPYYRAVGTEQRGVPGLGLGLYIAAEIIHRHQGRIWVESTEGKGTTFGFTIPIERQGSMISPQEIHD